MSVPRGTPLSEGPLLLFSRTATPSSDHHYSLILIWGKCTLVIDGDVTIRVGAWYWINAARIDVLPESRLHLYVGDWVMLGTGALLNAS
ncbi:MAG: hypothetical protein QHH07_02020 [Sedimentisphaerales bacterium]|jgi:hypothetical protein|nr:hypothetical protein [Sedimentisphaerales bacterium]